MSRLKPGASDSAVFERHSPVRGELLATAQHTTDTGRSSVKQNGSFIGRRS